MATRLQTIKAEALKAVTQTNARLFVLHFNHSRLRDNRPEKYAWESIDGTQYANGWVTLENGTAYHTLGDLKDMLEQIGDHRIDWILEEVQARIS